METLIGRDGELFYERNIYEEDKKRYTYEPVFLVYSVKDKMITQLEDWMREEWKEHEDYFYVDILDYLNESPSYIFTKEQLKEGMVVAIANPKVMSQYVRIKAKGCPSFLDDYAFEWVFYHLYQLHPDGSLGEPKKFTKHNKKWRKRLTV